MLSPALSMCSSSSLGASKRASGAGLAGLPGELFEMVASDLAGPDKQALRACSKEMRAQVDRTVHYASRGNVVRGDGGK